MHCGGMREGACDRLRALHFLCSCWKGVGIEELHADLGQQFAVAGEEVYVVLP